METSTQNKTTWAIDAAHSEIQFKVKHLVISSVTGSFTNFSGTVEAGENFSDSKIIFEADINSISTNNADRDKHLKSDDFFAVDKFPKLHFESTSFIKGSGDEFILKGNLTMKGVTKVVELKVEHGGVGTDPYSQVKAGFEINGVINRKDFGLTWGALTEAGGAVVSDEVKIHANIELLKK